MMLPQTQSEGPSGDDLLLQTLPVVPVPPSGQVPASSRGIRLLLASNGLFLEGDNGALCVRLPVGQWTVSPLPTPFGAFPEDRAYEWRVPAPDLRRWRDSFITQARRAWPLETAALVYYSHLTGMWRYDGGVTLDASSSHSRYRARPHRDEVVVFDLHSHGSLPAFFSSADDQDDQADSGAVKISLVFGRVHSDVVETAGRFVVGGACGATWRESFSAAHSTPPAPSFDDEQAEVVESVPPTLSGGDVPWPVAQP